MSYYPGRSVYRYFSKLDEAEDFKTVEEAAKFDCDLAIQLVTSTSVAGFNDALRHGDPTKLVAALRLLSDEIGDVPALRLLSDDVTHDKKAPTPEGP